MDELKNPHIYYDDYAELVKDVEVNKKLSLNKLILFNGSIKTPDGGEIKYNNQVTTLGRLRLSKMMGGDIDTIPGLLKQPLTQMDGGAGSRMVSYLQQFPDYIERLNEIQKYALRVVTAKGVITFDFDTLYAETSAGKALYSGEAVTGRYVRLYAMGKVGSNTTSGHENHIVEIQINGRAADADPYDLTEYRKVLKEAKTEAAKDIYTAESVAALNEQITASEALITELDAAINAGNQPDKSWSEVANAKAALEAAVAALAKNDGPVVEEDADYTAVNAAKEKAAGVDRSRYTDESLKALDDAVAAVVEGLKKSEQSRVDAMAAAINNAYAALVEKPAVEEDADYTAVNAAIAKADKIDRSKYTEESLKALDDAVAAVEKGLKESEQDKVDAMVAAIEKALDGLKKKPAADDDKKNDSKKDDSNKDDSNKNDLNKNDSDKKADAVKTTTVKTGDAANVIPFFGMTLLAAGAVIVIAFKKKRRA